MYLKNITLRGFKSFAKKSQLLFNRGICVIVGPNGSGKSNIVDAISWVLGEQSPKTLRGSTMEDVIFRNKQEELAIAEVSLLFDNSDKFLPLTFNDIKFTRRVYQKGGSEYFINSTPCRLLDILDITSERGIGKGLYTIINQGQIDEIALIKPLERKKLIDELIGISKHKTRRDKSIGNLSKVKSDINRIDDLLSEVRRTMDPLEIESKKAQKYFEILNNLKNEEISLFISELDEMNDKWEKENNKFISFNKKLDDIKNEIIKEEQDRKSFEVDFQEKQKIFEEIKSKIESFKELENRLDTIIDLVESKDSVFRTFNNMFEGEYRSLNNSVLLLLSGPTLKEKPVENKIIIKKLEEIKESIEKMFLDTVNFINDSRTIRDLKKNIERTSEDINDLIKVVENGSAANNDFGESVNDSINNTKEVELSRKKIEERLKTIKLLIENASQNIDAVKRLKTLLEGFRKSVKKLNNIFSERYSKLIVDISDFNSVLNNYMKKITDLNFLKNNYENEIFRADLNMGQIREKVKDITTDIVDNYNLSVEYVSKNYKQTDDVIRSRQVVRRLRNEIKNYGNINPNATIEFKRIKERYDFLSSQKDDLSESKIKLEELIKEINLRIQEIFSSKFEEINKNFNYYFKALFPYGNGDMIITGNPLEKGTDDQQGIDLKVDIGNNKKVPLSLLSGGEKALVSIAFLFSIFSVNYSPFYIFDEIDAALDDMNLNRYISLVKKFAETRQVIIITHQKKTMEIADTIYGVTMQSSGISKVISEKVVKIDAEVNKKS